MSETLRQIVLLYNDRERHLVDPLRARLLARLRPHGLYPWMAYHDMLAFGNLFDNIEDAIADALGVVVFIGPLGLGQFQRNIEMGAVSTERWLQGAAYGALLVHLAPGLQVPRQLLQWASVNHDGSTGDPDALVGAIVQRFGLDHVRHQGAP